MCWTQFGKCVEKIGGHKYCTEFKKFGPLRKLFATSGVPSWLRACFPLAGLAFICPVLPTCLVVHAQKSNFHLINVFVKWLLQKMYYVQPRKSSLILDCIATRNLWCLRPKLHICTACCSDSHMELIVQLEEFILGVDRKQSRAVSGLWMFTVATTQALVYIC